MTERDWNADMQMCELATEGQWKWDNRVGAVFGPDYCVADYTTVDDGMFIAESRQALPYWLNAYKAEKEARKSLEQRVKELEVNALRPELKWFAIQMELKLRANDHKQHLKDGSMDYLIMRLGQEIGELLEAIQKGDPDEIVKESADGSNFLMMIADNAEHVGGIR